MLNRQQNCLQPPLPGRILGRHLCHKGHDAPHSGSDAQRRQQRCKVVARHRRLHAGAMRPGLSRRLQLSFLAADAPTPRGPLLASRTTVLTAGRRFACRRGNGDRYWNQSALVACAVNSTSHAALDACRPHGCPRRGMFSTGPSGTKPTVSTSISSAFLVAPTMRPSGDGQHGVTNVRSGSPKVPGTTISRASTSKAMRNHRTDIRSPLMGCSLVPMTEPGDYVSAPSRR